jgi:hypothetical protein
MNESLNNLVTTGCFLVGQAVATAAIAIIQDSLRNESETHEGRHEPAIFATTKHGGSRKGNKVRRRIRRTIEEMHIILGDTYFRRAYRMSIESFWDLHGKLQEGIDAAASMLRRRRRNPNTNRLPPPVPNGKIPSSVRLGCALRYFGGGSPYDLMALFGISHTEVLSSVWMIVEAVNKHESFFIEYPSDQMNSEESSIDDRFRIENNELGFVPLEERTNCDVAVPLQLLDGGNHTDDLSRLEQRRLNRVLNNQDGFVLPREKLLGLVIDRHVARPRAK